MDRWCVFSLLSALALMVPVQAATAQSTSGVTSPAVRLNDRQSELRISIDPGGDSGETRTSLRLHYQQAFGDRFRLRGVVTGSDSGPGRFDLTQTTIQSIWQFAKKDEEGIDSALRFDYVLSNGDDVPDGVRLGWTADWPLSKNWKFRTVAFGTAQVGNNRQSGVFLETRAAFIRKFGKGHALLLQSFNQYGFTSGFGDFDEQNHTVGPAINFNISDRWALQASALFGVSGAATDTTIRTFIGYRF
ncbi:MAG: transporter [Pseudomonadota bacterium]